MERKTPSAMDRKNLLNVEEEPKEPVPGDPTLEPPGPGLDDTRPATGAEVPTVAVASEPPDEPLEPAVAAALNADAADEPLEPAVVAAMNADAADEPLEPAVVAAMNAEAPNEPLEPAVAAAMPPPTDDVWVEIEAGTNIGTAVVGHAVLEDRGFDATLIEANSGGSDEHMIRVPAKDEAAARAILLEVQTLS